MKDYNAQLKEIKVSLDKTGPGFCLAKWYHVSMHLHTGTNHSCYHPMPQRVSLDEIQANPSALHNSQWKKEQRKTMLYVYSPTLHGLWCISSPEKPSMEPNR